MCFFYVAGNFSACSFSGTDQHAMVQNGWTIGGFGAVFCVLLRIATHSYVYASFFLFFYVFLWFRGPGVLATICKGRSRFRYVQFNVWF